MVPPQTQLVTTPAAASAVGVRVMVLPSISSASIPVAVATTLSSSHFRPETYLVAVKPVPVFQFSSGRALLLATYSDTPVRSDEAARTTSDTLAFLV